MDTARCEVPELEQPVLQVPTGSATCPELAAAVADAGGLSHLAVVRQLVAETETALARPGEETT